MTKAKAKKLMLEHSREVVDPAFASKITQAFGFSLSDLGIKPQKVSDFAILYSEETKSLSAVAISEVSVNLAEKITGVRVYSSLMGRGSSAQDLVEQAVAII